MEVITKDRWLNALLKQQNGGRLNQMLSLMTGGEIEYVEWNQTSDDPWDMQGTVHLQYRELPSDPITRLEGIIVMSAFASLEDFSQDRLEQQLQWVRNTQIEEHVPVRLLLLAFSRDNFDSSEQPGMITEEQWEELLTDGIAMAIGVRAELQEVIVLPMVAYQNWLR